jgi:hypothetical protein
MVLLFQKEQQRKNMMKKKNRDQAKNTYIISSPS